MRSYAKHRGKFPDVGGHLLALDGVRGLAIVLVMFLHFTMYGGLRPGMLLDTLVHKIARAGWVGVDLFFVLSGFLITGILLDAKGNSHFFRNFYMRRSLRIFPLYFGVLFAYFVVFPSLMPVSEKFELLISDQIWYWTYLVNILIVRENWPSFNDINHFWSLAVEEQFYLFWPLVIFLVRRRSLVLICLFCIISSLAIRVGLRLADNATAAYVLTPARMDALAVGALLALIVRQPGGLSRLAQWAWPTAGVSAVALLMIFVWKRELNADDAVVQIVGYPLLAALFGALLIIAILSTPDSAIGKFFTSKTLMFFGRYSYALYVFHHPIILFMRRRGIGADSFPTLMGSHLPVLLLIIAVATAATISLALLSWYLWEAPFLRLKRFFPYQSSAKTGTGAEESAALMLR
jgi:peptidoglycan/LPS O-acetylase OafA/YrhL